MTASSSALLAIDASGPGCSVALWHGGGMCAARRVVLQRGHAAALMPLVRDTMADARLGWSAVAAVAVTVGPG
ncbi:MAG: tRNA (adenosine(37)-N6)-threonylcarbamoyltransferase complex dimerization subunit type 1 TsaB, partial [Proteobacteria bacterium]|nr:tRNA (adenosine(37)-N6)-threonylcarbamoyltransferase complex dimerization subunit type 1 TsaB [Pseudomonadota bacterium]